MRVERRSRRAQSPAADRQRLQKHHAWLEDRVRHAEKHDWDDGMKAHLAGQLSETKQQMEKPPNQP